MALAVEKHGLLRVDVQLGGSSYHPFLVDTGAEISLIPASLASNIKGKINRQLSRQPVMVDGSSIRCEGTVTCRIHLELRDTSAQFYIVPCITEGILGLDTLPHLDLQLTRERDGCSLMVMPYPNVNGFALLNDHARRSNRSGSGKCMLLLMNTLLLLMNTLLLAKNTLFGARFTAQVYVQARHTRV